jgi:hypothetical protein
MGISMNDLSVTFDGHEVGVPCDGLNRADLPLQKENDERHQC